MFDTCDFFIKSAKAFGVDAREVARVAHRLGMPLESGAIDVPEGPVSYVEFPLSYARAFSQAFPESVVAETRCVLEQREGELVLRELTLKRLTKAFDLLI